MTACGSRDNLPVSDFVLLMVDGREYDTRERAEELVRHWEESAS